MRPHGTRPRPPAAPPPAGAELLEQERFAVFLGVVSALAVATLGAFIGPPAGAPALGLGVFAGYMVYRFRRPDPPA